MSATNLDPDIIVAATIVNELPNSRASFIDLVAAYGKQCEQRERDRMVAMLRAHILDWEAGSRRQVKGCIEDLRVFARLLESTHV